MKQAKTHAKTTEYNILIITLSISTFGTHPHCSVIHLFHADVPGWVHQHSEHRHI